MGIKSRVKKQLANLLFATATLNFQTVEML